MCMYVRMCMYLTLYKRTTPYNTILLLPRAYTPSRSLLHSSSISNVKTRRHLLYYYYDYYNYNYITYITQNERKKNETLSHAKITLKLYRKVTLVYVRRTEYLYLIGWPRYLGYIRRVLFPTLNSPPFPLPLNLSYILLKPTILGIKTNRT